MRKNVLKAMGVFVVALLITVGFVAKNRPPAKERNGIFSIEVDHVSPDDYSKIQSIDEYSDFASGNHFVKIDYGVVAKINPVRTDIPLRFCTSKGVKVVSNTVIAAYEYDQVFLVVVSGVIFLACILVGAFL